MRILTGEAARRKVRQLEARGSELKSLEPGVRKILADADATVKIHTTCRSVQSCELLATTPWLRINGELKMLQAYTEPMHR